MDHWSMDVDVGVVEGETVVVVKISECLLKCCLKLSHVPLPHSYHLTRDFVVFEHHLNHTHALTHSPTTTTSSRLAASTTVYATNHGRRPRSMRSPLPG